MDDCFYYKPYYVFCREAFIENVWVTLGELEPNYQQNVVHWLI